MRVAAVAAGCLAAVPVPAHHGIARYDMDAVLTVEATVERWSWQQPHTSLDLRVSAQGGVLRWRIEGAPPRWMSGQGWTPESLMAGEAVVVTYHPVRRPDGDRDGILMEVERADGTVLKVNRPARLGGP